MSQFNLYFIFGCANVNAHIVKYINGNTFAIANAASPFSGVGLSGMGAESGVEGIQMYLRPKTVMTGISESLR